jgi:uncharacterized SAM-binding protein YcdF (DUF218 family)
MTGKEKALGILTGIFLVLAVLCGFVLPGVRFSGALFMGLATLCLLDVLLRRWMGRSRKRRMVYRAFCVFLLLGLAAFVAAEGLVFWDSGGDADAEPDAVIVLGAGVNGTTPSLALQSRIDAAEKYLKQHPGIPAVLSGGQGAGEDVSEAQAMYDALVKDGVDPGRLLLEDRSTSTAENFQFSKERLQQWQYDTDSAVIAVVTNDFHLYRARRLARREGLTTVGVPAKLPWWWLSANYYVREAFALGKMLLT